MLNEMLGKKIGMTQVFDGDGKVVPVTVINVGSWFITQVKTPEQDGYGALQIGLVKNRYKSEAFSEDWVKSKAKYFLHLKEVLVEGELKDYTVGQQYTLEGVSLEEGDTVAVTGYSRGLGFQGVVKRWGFAGGPKTHGSVFHRIPGSVGNLRTQGEIVKGKKLPGQMGNKQVTVKGLKVVRIDREANCVFIKGAVPGKKDTLIAIKK